MNDGDILAQLDFSYEQPCDSPGHAVGTLGCEPARHAEYVIETRRCLGEGKHSISPWSKGFVCRGNAAALRSATNHTTKCGRCGIETTVGSLVRVVGMIAVNPKRP